MAVRLSAAEARRLGLGNTPASRPRTTRREARGPYATRCVLCGETFETIASEDRHVTLTHARFELVL